MTIYSACAAILAADAESRVAKSGKAWTRLRVSIGEGDSRTYLSVSCFGDLADDAASLRKGDVIAIEGSIRLNRWQGQDGIEKSELAIAASSLRRAKIGRNKPKSEKEPYHSGRSAPANRLEKPAEKPSEKGAGGGRPWDDEIPFGPEMR